VDRVAGESLARANNGAFEEASAKDDINVCTYLPCSYDQLSLIFLIFCIARVFELCLAEIEKKLAGKHAAPGSGPAESDQSEKSGCVIM
jgi:hypothetical protein